MTDHNEIIIHRRGIRSEDLRPSSPKPGDRVRSKQILQRIRDPRRLSPKGKLGTIKILYQQIIAWDDGTVSLLDDVLFEVIEDDSE